MRFSRDGTNWNKILDGSGAEKVGKVHLVDFFATNLNVGIGLFGEP